MDKVGLDRSVVFLYRSRTDFMGFQTASCKVTTGRKCAADRLVCKIVVQDLHLLVVLLHGLVVRLHRLVVRLHRLVYAGFALVSCAGFVLQPHSTSQQSFAKFLNAEKMAKCPGTWRIYSQSERTALTSPSGKG